MLEIRNLSKTYRSKTGESVKALDNISINFAESGMVFILGKSGSGKSTLLNVMGGLDSYDSGEFVIMGRSSKEFGGSDFDAYRNTFIGFIFQEYNVLDDFSVGANIGLALELQGKKATDEKINEILAKVDLLNYAKRKPNELSGGQKQRVAIARALVKDPQIIMADEPTGALDSNTGKQIFDTLKELSKEKLVLIVSHDRDFAEKYADRIIELSDGSIISDVTKHEKESVHLSAGLEQVTSNILRIKGGYRLTPADLEMINAYLASNNSGDILLSSDGKVNNELRSAAGIGDNGNTAVFEGTHAERDVRLKEYDKSKTRFIHSRLPMKNAVKMGSSGLKHKKFRLVMTVLLSLIAFTMFGFADTLASYNKWTAAKSSIMDSNIKNASVELGVRVTTNYSDGDESVYYNIQGMNNEDIRTLSEKTGLDFVPVYTGGNVRFGNTFGFSVATLMQSYQENTVYNGKLSGLVNMSAESVSKAGLNVIGRLPENKGEIAITEFMYRQFNQYGFKNAAHNESVSANSLNMIEGDKNSIIGKHLTISGGSFAYIDNNGYDFVIVGIIDTQFDYERYADYMPDAKDGSTDTGIGDMVLQSELSDELNYGFHALGFAMMEDILSLSSMAYGTLDDVMVHMHGYDSSHYIGVTYSGSLEDEKMQQHMGNNNYLSSYSSVAGSNALSRLNITWLDGNARTTLGENEVVVPDNVFVNLIPYTFELTLSEADIIEEFERIYGTGSWAQTEGRYGIVDRASMAQGLKYISEVLSNSDRLNELIEQVNNDPERFNGNRIDPPTKEMAEQWWIDLWYKYDNPVCPVYFDDPELQEYNKERYMFESDRGAILANFNSFMAKLLKIELPESLKNEYISELTNGIENWSVENNTIIVSKGMYVTILRNIEAKKVVNEKKLWKNEAFVDLMFANEIGGESKRAWDNSDENFKIDQAEWFYSSNYLTMEELGFNKNEFGGKSGKEITAEGEKIFEEKLDFDLNDIFSLIDIESYTENYKLGTSSVIKNYDFNIVGYYTSAGESVIISDKIISDYKEWNIAQREANGWETYIETVAEHEAGIWAFAVAPMSKDADIIGKLVDMSYDENAELRFSMKNSVMNTLGNFNEFIEMGAKIFLYVGIGFAVFAALLLMNFIATSISYKKREIGVLRAVGARSSDVFKIFFSEALIIALINFVLSFAALVAAVMVVNNVMHNEGINITLLTLGIRQVALMLGVSVLVAGLSSFLPVYSIAKRKPIDAIRDK